MLLIFVIVVTIGAALIGGVIQRRSVRLRGVSANLLITYTVITLILVGGELYFRYAYAESDGLPTLASQNWLARFWQTNTLDYRDREWTPADIADKHTILAVGDSFTAGWGLDDPAQRYSDILAARLGDEYAVINLGEPGSTTVDHLNNLRTYPLQQPDTVLWQYFLNDIDNAALSIGLDPGLNPLASVPAWANESYLGNFLYWRFASSSVRGSTVYSDWLFAMYDHAVVWDIHSQQIDAMIDHIEQSGAALIVVIFPDMLHPFDSIPYVDRVAQVFERRGLGERVIRLFDAAESIPLEQRIVSARDGHPSAAFSQVVADLIYTQFFTGSR